MNDRDDPSDPEENRGSAKGPLPRRERPDEACDSDQQLDRVRDVGDATHDLGARATRANSHATGPRTAAPITGKMRVPAGRDPPEDVLAPVGPAVRTGDAARDRAPVGNATTAPARNPTRANARMTPDGFRARQEGITGL